MCQLPPQVTHNQCGLDDHRGRPERPEQRQQLLVPNGHTSAHEQRVPAAQSTDQERPLHSQLREQQRFVTVLAQCSKQPQSAGIGFVHGPGHRVEAARDDAEREWVL